MIRSLVAADRLVGGHRRQPVPPAHDPLPSKPSFHITASATDLLAAQGIAREITGKRRGRLHAYDR